MLVPERATNRTIAVSGWMLSTLARLGGFPSYRGTPRHVAWLNVSGTMSRFRTRAIENSATCVAPVVWRLREFGPGARYVDLLTSVATAAQFRHSD